MFQKDFLRFGLATSPPLDCHTISVQAGALYPAELRLTSSLHLEAKTKSLKNPSDLTNASSKKFFGNWEFSLPS